MFKTLDDVMNAPRTTVTCPCGVSFEAIAEFVEPGLKCAGCRESERRAEEREQNRRRIIDYALASIPERYHWATFDAPELAQRVKDPRAIIDARGAIEAERVVLMGPAGVGKTVLSACLLRACAARGTYVMFVDALALSQARAHHALGSEAPLVVEARRAKVLVLDDVGSDKQIHNSAVGDVIFERHQRMRRSIITTGFTPEQLKERYGDGIARRIFEGAAIIDLRPWTTRRGPT